MLYDWNFGDRARCSAARKKECEKLIPLFLELSLKASREGLLALEDELDEIPEGIMKRGIQWMVDGVDPEILRELLERMILTGGRRGRELLSQCMIMEGVMSIQAGDHPSILQDKLAVFLGGAIEKNYYYELAEKHAGEYMESVKDEPPLSGETSLLEGLVNADDRLIQRALCELDIVVLARALRPASGKVKLKVFGNMSGRARNNLIDDMRRLFGIDAKELADAQKQFRAVIDKIGKDFHEAPGV